MCLGTMFVSCGAIFQILVWPYVSSSIFLPPKILMFTASLLKIFKWWYYSPLSFDFLNHSWISLSDFVSSELRYPIFNWNKVLYILNTTVLTELWKSVSVKITNSTINIAIPYAQAVFKATKAYCSLTLILQEQTVYT